MTPSPYSGAVWNIQLPQSVGRGRRVWNIVVQPFSALSGSNLSLLLTFHGAKQVTWPCLTSNEWENRYLDVEENQRTVSISKVHLRRGRKAGQAKRVG